MPGCVPADSVLQRAQFDVNEAAAHMLRLQVSPTGQHRHAQHSTHLHKELGKGSEDVVLGRTGTAIGGRILQEPLPERPARVQPLQWGPRWVAGAADDMWTCRHEVLV